MMPNMSEKMLFIEKIRAPAVILFIGIIVFMVGFIHSTYTSYPTYRRQIYYYLCYILRNGGRYQNVTSDDDDDDDQDKTIPEERLQNILLQLRSHRIKQNSTESPAISTGRSLLYDNTNLHGSLYSPSLVSSTDGDYVDQSSFHSSNGIDQPV